MPSYQSGPIEPLDTAEKLLDETLMPRLPLPRVTVAAKMASDENQDGKSQNARSTAERSCMCIVIDIVADLSLPKVISLLGTSNP